MELPTINRRAIPEGATFSIWEARDGWVLRRLDWPQPDGIAARGSLFFTGGRGDFAEKYLEALAHWHDRGWHVTSVDWRGQGGSRGTIVGGNFEDFDPLVEDAADFLTVWAREWPGPHVAIAHSMGGHLLLRAIAEHDPPLDAAVLVAPMLGINSGPLPAFAAPLVARVLGLAYGRRSPAWKVDGRYSRAARIRQANLTSSEERFEDEQWWKEREPGFELGAPSWGWLGAAFRSTRRPTPAELRGIGMPVLLIGTDRDRLVNPAAIHRVAAQIPGAQLFMFADAAHELLRESDPARIEAFRRIDAFLDEHARP